MNFPTGVIQLFERAYCKTNKILGVICICSRQILWRELFTRFVFSSSCIGNCKHYFVIARRKSSAQPSVHTQSLVLLATCKAIVEYLSSPLCHGRMPT